VKPFLRSASPPIVDINTMYIFVFDYAGEGRR